MKRLIAATVLTLATLAPTTPAFADHGRKCIAVGTLPNGKTIIIRVVC